MKLLTSLAVAVPLLAQNTITPTASSTNVKPNSQITVQLNYSGAALAGVQWGMAIPTGVVAPAVAGSMEAQAAVQKTLFCNTTSSTCLVVGLNANTFTSGQLAVYTATMPSGIGPYTFSLTNTLGASATGSAVVVGAGPNIVVNVLSKYDLDGNGTIDQADLGLAAAQVNGGTCSSTDFNGDGKCDIVDVVMLTLASMGSIPK